MCWACPYPSGGRAACTTRSHKEENNCHHMVLPFRKCSLRHSDTEFVDSTLMTPPQHTCILCLA